MICERCGANIDPAKRQCAYCGFYPEKLQPPPQAAEPPPVIYHIHHHQVAHNGRPLLSSKNRRTALLLCLAGGYLGAHKFYVGKVGAGILYLLTFGLFGFGWVVDLITIALGSSTDRWGRRLA